MKRHPKYHLSIKKRNTFQLLICLNVEILNYCKGRQKQRQIDSSESKNNKFLLGFTIYTLKTEDLYKV